MTGIPGPHVLQYLDMQAIHAWLVENTSDMVDDLVVLANLETPSDDLELLHRGLARVEHWVVERLGTSSTRSLSTSDQYGPVLVLDYEGEGEGEGETRVVGLGHYDTVFGARHLGIMAD